MVLVLLRRIVVFFKYLLLYHNLCWSHCHIKYEHRSCIATDGIPLLIQFKRVQQTELLINHSIFLYIKDMPKKFDKILIELPEHKKNMKLSTRNVYV